MDISLLQQHIQAINLASSPQSTNTKYHEIYNYLLTYIFIFTYCTTQL